ncbi:DinB family protein [Metabacillus sp. KIGAM252]|uniref:DinB family protein n=1 Tax=Metabacillus flavus TaxID=2823519 RepID=A0ABS5LCJ6_9BACI|nr:DinB family protein [Metabacillus flavus]MBS2968461.1 DinB family protein [Metabacillus flavus]
MSMLSNQYKLVKQTRELLFEFCEGLDSSHYTQELEAFGWGSIRNLHVHVAMCYQSWLKRFGLKQEHADIKEGQIKNVEEMRRLFEKVDRLVLQFLIKYEDAPYTLLKGKVSWQEEEEELSVLWLLTHTMTHEFHHKGQIVSIARHLGYTPADTDLIIPADKGRLIEQKH